MRLRGRSLRRKLAFAGLGLFALLVIAVAALWFLKPWVPEIELTEPGATGRRVVESGLYANYFPAGVRQAPGVLLLGGSEGGIGSSLTRQATSLQTEGFSVLTPSYFGAPGQPENLELVALETFDRALEWLRDQKEVDPQRVAVVGHSKGAEAALLVGTRHRDLKAVIASAPSSAVWPGINWSKLKAESSWTSSGRPLAALPYGSVFSAFRGIGRLYTEGLKHSRKHPKTAIEIERIRTPVLLVCGERDTLWPACRMSRQLKARADDAGGPEIRILAYERAGHRAFGPALATDDPGFERLGGWGGTPAANNAAHADGWPKVVNFLQSHLEH
jgi:dienelactone hydrolase